MSIAKKIAQIEKSEKSAQKNLNKLVLKRASKKKILKSVATIQELDKERKKLQNKLKDRAPAPAKKKVKSGPKKKKSGDKAKSKKEAKSKPGSSPKNKSGNPAPAKTNGLSTDMNAKTAIASIVRMHSEQDIKTFVQKDTRQSVLSRAKSRLNALRK